MRSLAAALVATLLVAGCIYVPTPQHAHLGGHGLIGDEEAGRIRPGESSREDVLLLLGEPDYRLGDDRLFVYAWTRIGGYLFSQGGGGPVPRRNLFAVLFDGNGQVLRRGWPDFGFFTDLGHPGDAALPEAAEEWAAGED